MKIDKLNNEMVEVEKEVQFGYDRIKLTYYDVQKILTFMEEEGIC